MKVFRFFLISIFFSLLLSCEGSSSSGNDEELPKLSITLLSPDNKSAEQEVETKLTWEGDASSYYLYFSDDPQKLNLVKGLTDTFYIRSGLEYGTTYYWQVESLNGEESLKSGIWSFKTKQKALFVELLSPKNYGVTEISADFAWNSNALRYDLYLGKSKEELKMTKEDLGEMAHTVNNLDYWQRYYWQVVGRFAEKEIFSEIKTFITKRRPVFELLTPADGSQDNFTTIDLRWEKKIELDSYALYLGTSELNIYKLKTAADDKTNTQSYSYPLRSLTYQQTYYWQLRGYLGDSEYFSDLSSFSTKGKPIVELVEPVSGAVDQSKDPRVVWLGENIAKYFLYCDTVISDSMTLVDSFASDTSSVLNNLDYDCIYFWQVVADDGKVKIKTDMNTLTTRPAPIVSLLAPPLGADEQYPNLTMHWTGRDDIDYYRLMVGKDSSSLVLRAITKDTSSFIKSLDYGTTYYWNVAGENEKGSFVSKTNWFITKGEPKVTLGTPANMAVGQSPELTLSWHASNVRKVALYVDVFVSDMELQEDSLPSTDTSYLMRGLRYGQRYFWKVVVYDGDETLSSTMRSFVVKDGPSVNLSQPADEVAGLLSEVNFAWSADNVENITLYVDTIGGDNMAVAANLMAGAASDYTLAGLRYGQRYYWKIAADNGIDTACSKTRSFTIKNKPSVAAISPNASDDVQFPDLILRWGGSYAEEYTLYLDTSATQMKLLEEHLSGSTTRYAVKNLAYGRTYYWKVVGADQHDSDTSAILSFTIKDAPSVSLKAPLDGTCELLTKIPLSWSGENIKSYDVWLGTTPTSLEKVASGLTQESNYYPDLQYGKTYYWRVDAYDGQVIVSSGTYSFATKDNPRVNLYQPINKTKGLSPSPTLSWGVSNAQRITLYFGTTATDMKVIEPALRDIDTSYQLQDLDYNQTYYWKIAAYNGQDTIFSGTHSFTIRGEPSISLGAPAAAAVGQFPDLTLDWSASNAQAFTLYFDTVSTNMKVTEPSLSGSARSYAMQGLSYGQEYFWQVLADGGKKKDVSQVRSFTIKDEPTLSVGYPHDGVEGLLPDVDLGWSASNVEKITLKVITTIDGNPFKEEITLAGSDTSYTLQGLFYGQTYCWQIDAFDGQATLTSPERCFTIKDEPIISLLEPIHKVAEQFPQLTLSWSASNVDGLTLYLDTIAGDSMATEMSLLPADQTSYEAKGLAYGKTYYWRVTGNDAQDTIASSTHSFSTKGEPQVSLSEPSANAVGQFPNLALSWSGSNVNDYALYFDTKSTNMALEKSGLTKTSYELQELLYGQKYYWSVLADDGQKIVNSGVGSFTIKGKPSVALREPQDYVTEQFPTLGLSWTGSHVASYSVWLGTKADSMERIVSGLKSTSRDIADFLEYGKTYYWKIEAFDGQKSLFSDMRCFSIKGEPSISVSQPAEEAEGVLPDVRFFWRADNVKEVRLYLDTVDSPSMAVDDSIFTCEATSFAKQDLDYGKTYYWKVVGFDGQKRVSSRVRRFTIKGKPTLALSEPSANAVGQFPNLALSWDGANLDEYTLYFDTTITNMKLKARGLTKTSFDLSDLIYEQKYYWALMGSDDQDTLKSDTLSFTIKKEPSFAVAQPASGIVEQFLDITLSWEGKNVEHYDVWLGTKTNDLENIAAGLKDTSKNIKEYLDYGQTYYWQVDAFDGQKTLFSEIRSFSTKGKATIDLSQPLDKAARLLPDVRFSWRASNARKLTLYVDTIDGGAGKNMKVEVDSFPLSQSDYALENLSYGQTYYWKLEAFDGEEKVCSDVRSFTIKAEPTVSLDEPRDNAAGLFPRLALSWSGANVDEYALYFGTSESTIKLKARGLTKTSFPLHDLDYSQIYYWRVEGKDDQDVVKTVVRNFSTKGRPSVTLKSPLSGAEEQYPHLMLTWEGENLEDYDLWLGTKTHELKKIDSNLTATSYELEGLEYSQDYYWQVVGDDGQDTVPSDLFSFKTKGEPSVWLKSPSDGITELLPDVSLGWSSNNVKKLKLYFDVIKGENMEVEDSLLTSTDSSKTLDDLIYGQIYYWKVAAFDGQKTISSLAHSFTIKGEPTIELGKPSHEADGLSPSLALDWSGSNVDDYTLYFGTDQTAMQVKASGPTDTSFALPNLDYGTTYYWAVEIKDEQDTVKSETRSFTIKDKPNIVLSQPADAAAEVLPDVSFIWSVSDGRKVTLYLDTIDDGAGEHMAVEVDSFSSEQTTYAVADLQYGQEYFWKIAAFEEQKRVVSATHSFTIKEKPTIELSEPSHEAQGVFPNLALKWSGSNVDDYTLYFGATPTAMEVKESGSTDTSYDLTGLDYGKTYYWAVEGSDEQDTVKSVTHSFTIKDEPTIDLSQPEGGAEEQFLALTLSWEGENADYYDVWLGKKTDELVKIDSFLVGTSKSLIGHLHYSQDYYWRIDAYDGQKTFFSKIRGFSTKSEPTIDLKNPTDKQGDIRTSTTLNWNCSNVEELSLYFDTVSDQTMKKIQEHLPSTATSHEVGNLQYEQEYFWKVVVFDGQTTDTSETYSFTIKGAPSISLSEPADAATDVFNDVSLSWDASNIDEYTLYFDTTNTFTSEMAFIKSGLTHTSYDLPDLQYEQKYYWKVVGNDEQSSAESKARSFTIKSAPENNYLYPRMNTRIYQSHTHLWWISKNAKDVTLYLGTSATEMQERQEPLEGKSPNFLCFLKDLQYEQKYYWRVVSDDGHTKDTSDTWTFFINGPPTVSVIGPTVDDGEQYPDVELKWRGEHLQECFLYFGTSATEMSPKWVQSWDTSYQLSDLQYDQTYYWQVVGRNYFEYDSSQIQSFTIRGEPSVEAISPTVADGLQFSNLTLKWSGNNVNSYKVYSWPFGTNRMLKESNWTKTSYDLKGLDYGKSYYWEIVADDGQKTVSTGWKYFHVKGKMSITLDEPADETKSPYLSQTLKWTGQNVEDYDVWLGTSPNMLFKKESNLTSTSYEAENLRRGKTYYWKIVMDNGEKEESSEIYSFSILEELQGSLLSPADNVLEQLVFGVAIRWEGNADTYDVYWKKDSGEYELKISDLESNAYFLSDLEYKTTYHWKVVGKRGDETVECGERSFTTEKNLAFTNSIGVKMLLVEAGTFQMGSTEGDSDEEPVHSVTISDDYYLSEKEVSYGEAVKIFNWASKYYDGGEERAFSIILDDGKLILKYGERTMYSSEIGKPLSYNASTKNFFVQESEKDKPLANLSWSGVVGFAMFLNTKEKVAKYRMPTEAEWEFAARGGNMSKRCKYAGSNTIDDVAWYSENSSDEAHARGKKSPNELGFYDMTGNVWEWCYDWYDTYPSAALTDYLGPKNPSNSIYGYALVNRGGSFKESAAHCRSFKRYASERVFMSKDLGFRLFRED